MLGPSSAAKPFKCASGSRHGAMAQPEMAAANALLASGRRRGRLHVACNGRRMTMHCTARRPSGWGRRRWVNATASSSSTSTGRRQRDRVRHARRRARSPRRWRRSRRCARRRSRMDARDGGWSSRSASPPLPAHSVQALHLHIVDLAAVGPRHASSLAQEPITGRRPHRPPRGARRSRDLRRRSEGALVARVRRPLLRRRLCMRAGRRRPRRHRSPRRPWERRPARAVGRTPRSVRRMPCGT